jgi:prevent-host-death family protein
MYTRIGSFAAKTNLSALLRAVRRGQRYTVTLHGQPMADLVPSQNAAGTDAHATVKAMQEMPKMKGVSGEDLAEWIAEGRR